jgi:hypothetical protein
MYGRSAPQAMNLRHAAALALLAWYLVLPPVVLSFPTAGPEFDTAAPLSTWSRQGTFITEPECRKSLEDRRSELGHRLYELRTRNSSALSRTRPYQWQAADCIASDDPRLKP